MPKEIKGDSARPDSPPAQKKDQGELEKPLSPLRPKSTPPIDIIAIVEPDPPVEAPETAAVVLEETQAEAPAEVPVGSLRVGNRFIYRGERYQAGITEENMRLVISLDKPQLGRQMFNLTDLVTVIK